MSDNATKSAEDWVPVALPVPTHWSYVGFEEAFDPISTNGIKTPEAQYAASGRFPIVDQGKEFIGGYTDNEDNVVNQDGTVIVFGDHTRCFKLISFPFAPGADGTKILRSAPYLAPKFAYYGCLSLKLPDRGYSRHYSFLKKSKFPVAPIEEQHRIVARIEELFSEVDSGVESLVIAREHLSAYRQSVLNKAVAGELAGSRNFPRKPLSAVVEEMGQGWSPRCLNHPSADDDIWAVITTTAIQHGAFYDQENKQLPQELEPRPHLSIQAGDILITRAGPRKRVGVACLVRRCRPRIMLCDKAYRLRADTTQIVPEWLELVLNSPSVLQQIEELKTGINDSGVNLTQNRFLALEIPVPKLAAQKAILSVVDRLTSRVRNLEAQIETAMKQSAVLRQSILKRAFSGQLVSQDSADEPASILLERVSAKRSGNDAIRRRKNKNSKMEAA